MQLLLLLLLLPRTSTGSFVRGNKVRRV